MRLNENGVITPISAAVYLSEVRINGLIPAVFKNPTGKWVKDERGSGYLDKTLTTFPSSNIKVEVTLASTGQVTKKTIVR